MTCSVVVACADAGSSSGSSVAEGVRWRRDEVYEVERVVWMRGRDREREASLRIIALCWLMYGKVVVELSVSCESCGPPR
jgi:hypothetical protein